MAFEQELDEDAFDKIDQFVKQKAFVAPVISATNLCSIYRCPDQQMYRARLQFLFGLDGYALDDDAREALIDMVHGAILFASDSELSYTKAIVFLSIYMQVFQWTVASSFYRPVEIHEKYQQLLLAHAVERPPVSTLIFDLADLNAINDFMINTFFRHMKLILHAFTRRPILDFKAHFPTQFVTPALPALADMQLMRSSDEVSGRLSSAERAEEPAKGSAQSTQSMAQASTRALPGKPTQAAAAAAVVPSPVVPPGPEDPGPEIPVEAVRTALHSMHEKFVADFEERERHLLGKIKELEIRLAERPQKKVPPKKK